MALGQTSPDDAEQIYLGDQPCRPLSAPRQATRADTPLLPGAPDGTQGPSDRLLQGGAQPCTRGSRRLSRELVPTARAKNIQADPPDRHTSLPVPGGLNSEPPQGR